MNKTNNSRGISKLKVLIIIVAVLLVGGTSAALIFRSQLVSVLITYTQTTPGKTLGTQKVQVSIDDAQAKVASGDAKGALNDLDKAIEQTSSDSEKAQLYKEKAAINAGTGDKTAATSDAQKAATADPSVESYDYLGYLYETQGNKDQAITAYQQAIDEYKKNPPKEDGQVSEQYYQTKINQLKAQ
jgi:tetratricopeptide (TPR) repeat protein